MRAPAPLVLTALAVASAAALSGCGRSGGTRTAETRDTVTFAIHNEPPTIDPGIVQDVDAGGLLQDIYEGLVAYSPTNEVIPQLAEKVDAQGATITFTLRDAKFHNGRAVTSQDFKWSWERNLNPKLASPTAMAYLGDIVGAKEFNTGKAKEVVGISCPNPKTLVVLLDKPRAYFLGKLTYPTAFVLAKEAVGDGTITNEKQSVGTGPMTFGKYVKNQEIDLERFEAYYGEKPGVAHVRRPIIKDASTRLTKYRSGGLDFLVLERADVKGVDNDPKLKADLKPLPRPAVYFIAPNPRAYAPFRDVRVRRAFGMAIDRRRIAEDVIGLPQTNGLLPPGIPGYRADVKGIPFDVSAARKLLAAAGYPGGKGLPRLSLTYRAGRPDSERLAAATVTDLRTNLGVPIDGGGSEFGALLENRRKGSLPMASLSWYGDYLDAQNFLSLLFRTDAPQNFEAVSDPVADAAMDIADASNDPAERARKYAEAEDALLAGAYRFPVYCAQDPLLVKPYVEGLDTNLFGVMPIRRVRMKG